MGHSKVLMDYFTYKEVAFAQSEFSERVNDQKLAFHLMFGKDSFDHRNFFLAG